MANLDSPPGTRRAGAAALAEAGWMALQDRLLRGLCHDLNGRIGSLNALSYLLEVGEPLPMSHEQEAERLADVVRRLGALTGDPDAEAAPFALPELVQRALSLHAHLKDHEGTALECDVGDGVPAVLVCEPRCLRLLILFVDLASGLTEGAGRTVRVTGDPSGAEVSFPCVDPLSESDAMALLDQVAALDGGRIAAEGGCVRLVLPSLARARAGETAR